MGLVPEYLVKRKWQSSKLGHLFQWVTWSRSSSFFFVDHLILCKTPTFFQNDKNPLNISFLLVKIACVKNVTLQEYGVRLAWAGFELTTLVVIGTDYIGSYKSNYHTITTAPI